MDSTTVYIVDDDPSVRSTTGELLEGIGLNVVTFADGESFLAAYDHSRPGCIVLDLRLPGCAGLEVLEKLHPRAFNSEVIVLSAFGNVRDAVSAMRHGACNVLEKPCNPKVLLKEVQAAIARIEGRKTGSAPHFNRDTVDEQLASLTDDERGVLNLDPGRTR
jgi:FixJ family two-component response regulator